MTTLYCYANNQIKSIENAGVPISDLLVQRGYGIFDFLRVAYHQPLFLDDHLDRFFNSAAAMRLPINESKEEIKKIVATLIEKNNLEFAGIRLLIAKHIALSFPAGLKADIAVCHSCCTENLGLICIECVHHPGRCGQAAIRGFQFECV